MKVPRCVDVRKKEKGESELKKKKKRGGEGSRTVLHKLKKARYELQLLVRKIKKKRENKEDSHSASSSCTPRLLNQQLPFSLIALSLFSS